MFYAYDFGQIAVRFRWEYDRFFGERWCREALAALRAHAERTDDPRDAAFFVVPATLRCLSFAAIDEEALARHIDRLPFRTTGKPHVYFDLKDSPRPHFQGSQAIVCKSAFHERYYDPEAGLPIPQFPRYRFDRPLLPASGRRHLAGFKGNPRRQHGDLRARLLALNDDDRFVLHGRVLQPADLHIAASGAVCEVVGPGELSHEDILFQSTFALLPRACGYALSYRLIECMNAGCIPVILSDGHVLPFSDDLDYGRFAIRVAEADVERLGDILRQRLPEADALQRNVLEVYESHFASTERIVNQVIRLVDRRVRAQPPALTAIANRHRCDKGTLVGLAGPPHGYTPVYEQLLSPFLRKPVRLLEIGVYRGASLRTWQEYLPKAQIYGLDRRDTRHLGNERVTIYVGDQENREDLRRLSTDSGGRFDIIIDDGGHRMSQQQVALGCLFPALNPGGTYCIEDLHTSNDPSYGAGVDGSNSTLAMLRGYLTTGRFVSLYLTEPEVDALHRTVDSVTLHCQDRLAVIRKKAVRATAQALQASFAQPRRPVARFRPEQLTPSGAADKPCPLVSIIVAVFNVPEYLPEALESCLNQTYANIEIVLVDDGSTDETARLCDRYAEQHRQVRLLRNPRNRGVYISRNLGLQAAGGAFLCWHDGDDRMHPERVRWQLQALQLHEEARASVAWHQRLERSGERVVRHLLVPNSYCPTMLFHRDVVEEMGYFDSVRAMADREYFDRFLRCYGTESLVIVEQVVRESWKRPGSLTQSQEIGEGSAARTAYFHSFRAWHRAAPRLYMAFPLDQRPFPAPVIMVSD